MKNSMLQKIFLLIILCNFGQSAFGQDSCIKLIQAEQKYVSSSNVRSILSSGSEWECIAYYDVLKDSMSIGPSPKNIMVLGKHKINYVTNEDKLTFNGKNAFKIQYGGRGPEIQAFEITYFDGTCLILESTIENKGYFNGKLLYYEKRTVRYLWRKN